MYEHPPAQAVITNLNPTSRQVYELEGPFYALLDATIESDLRSNLRDGIEAGTISTNHDLRLHIQNSSHKEKITPVTIRKVEYPSGLQWFEIVDHNEDPFYGKFFKFSRSGEMQAIDPYEHGMNNLKELLEKGTSQVLRSLSFDFCNKIKDFGEGKLFYQQTAFKGTIGRGTFSYQVGVVPGSSPKRFYIDFDYHLCGKELLSGKMVPLSKRVSQKEIYQDTVISIKIHYNSRRKNKVTISVRDSISGENRVSGERRLAPNSSSELVFGPDGALQKAEISPQRWPLLNTHNAAQFAREKKRREETVHFRKDHELSDRLVRLFSAGFNFHPVDQTISIEKTLHSAIESIMHSKPLNPFSLLKFK